MTTEENDQPEVERRHSDIGSIDSELIGIVYEVAFDPNFWPDLLESVACLFSDRRSEDQHLTVSPDDYQAQIQLFSKQIDKGEAQRLAMLLPHLYRALKLKRDYNQADHTRGQAQAILDHFPIGVLLVSGEGKIISANQHALDTIDATDSVYMEGDVLCTALKEKDQQLKDLIYKAANTSLDDAVDYVTSIKIDDKGGGSPISLLVSPDPYPNSPYDSKVDNCAAIFIASASGTQNIATSALQSLFNLTPAEARLAALLASGVSLNQAAEQSYIARNTAKAQLKSIFTKMGVSRQGELIKRILTSPAVFNPADSTSEDAELKTEIKSNSHINKEGHIILRDGRHLQYAEYGDSQGKPVMHIHGVLGCRYERIPDDSVAKTLGIRLIIPDRPGYGLSEHNLEHGYLDFADDLLELADYLELQQFSIMGLSVGAIYASALAFKASERLLNIAMISSTPPFRSFADFAGVPPSLKLLIAFSKYLPTAAQLTAEIAIKNACKNPGKFLANIPVCASDQAIFLRPYLKQHIEACLLAGSNKRHSGFVRDIILSAEPWPFPVSDIRIKMVFWHGTEDQHSPISRIKPVIDAIPNSHLIRIEGGGHFLIYDHWQAILHTLIG